MPMFEWVVCEMTLDNWWVWIWVWVVVGVYLAGGVDDR